jgi:hypothetical protein
MSVPSDAGFGDGPSFGWSGTHVPEIGHGRCVPDQRTDQEMWNMTGVTVVGNEPVLSGIKREPNSAVTR